MEAEEQALREESEKHRQLKEQEKQLELQKQRKQKQEEQQRKLREEMIRQENARKVSNKVIRPHFTYVHMDYSGRRTKKEDGKRCWSIEAKTFRRTETQGWSKYLSFQGRILLINLQEENSAAEAELARQEEEKKLQAQKLESVSDPICPYLVAWECTYICKCKCIFKPSVGGV